jgi:hypothetical protein
MSTIAKGVVPSDSWDKTSSGNYGGMPDDSEEKIQYGFRMILEAHRGRSSTSDNEIRSLRQTIEELKATNATLNKKCAAAEREIMEQQHRNQLLAKDNENLAMANRQLLQRVEKYKRIQQTFSEALENSGHEEDLTPMAMMSGEYRAPIAPPPAAVSGGAVFSSSATSASSSIPTPTAVASMQMSPKTATASNGGEQQRQASGGKFDSAGKDGKQFFRVVRTRLPFEAFNAFLTIIKKLNAHEYTRETAVEEAKKIFGNDNQDLLGDFQALISRHISSS